MTLYNYDDMVQAALRQVVKKTLEITAVHGLSGHHHFYISFRTDHPDVALPLYLKEHHPEEITIVLQYQFWGLEVDDKGFEVTLSFNDVHERLKVPFDALTSFVDPSVKFGLQFIPNMTSIVPKELTSPAVAIQPETESSADSGNVIVLDAFRKKEGAPT